MHRSRCNLQTLACKTNSRENEGLEFAADENGNRWMTASEKLMMSKMAQDVDVYNHSYFLLGHLPSRHLQSRASTPPHIMPHIPLPELLERNKQYAAKHISQLFSTEQLKKGPGTILISCFGPRSIPEEFFQIRDREREIVSIRNAGGHTRHIVHDIVILDTLLMIEDILVVHHTDCGMTHLTNERIREYVKENGKGKGAEYDVEGFDFGAMTSETLAESCREDVRFLKEHPWIKKGVDIVGYMYDIKTGLLHEV